MYMTQFPHGSVWSLWSYGPLTLFLPNCVKSKGHNSALTERIWLRLRLSHLIVLIKVCGKYEMNQVETEGVVLCNNIFWPIL